MATYDSESKEWAEVTQTDELDAQHASHLAKLVFLSYKFSQGGIGTQNRLLLYIEDEHHPEIFSPEVAPVIKELAKPLIGKFFLSQSAHPATAVPWEDQFPGTFVKTPVLVENEVNGLFERFMNRGNLEEIFAFDAPSMAASVIAMDYDYLTRPGGRAGVSEELKVKVSEYNRDPYDSLYIKYGLFGISTHVPEFDEIFSVISDEYTIENLDQIAIMQLIQILKVYIQQHPDIKDLDKLDRISKLYESLQNGRR